MKSNKLLMILALVFGLVFTITAQVDRELAFAETVHDFGIINEVDGPVEHEFVFTNTGAEAIKIVNVRASCGCTTPGWTREEIPSGGKGFVKARYNPANRPGPFNKSLTITADGNTSTYVLYIKGKVNPRPRTIEDDFPTVIGGLRVKNRAFTMGKALNNTPVTRVFPVYNASEESISWLDSMEGPDYIKIKMDPKTLEPKKKGSITVTYDVIAKNDLGNLNDNVVLYTNEKENARKVFSVYVNVEEYFAPMTPEELAQAPKLVIDEPLYDFGRIKQGDVVTKEFTFRNEGKSTLNIRKTNSTCGCTVAAMDKKELLPGDEARISIRFNSSGRRGQQQKSITIFSNDPKSPTQRIMIKAFIEVQ